MMTLRGLPGSQMFMGVKVVGTTFVSSAPEPKLVTPLLKPDGWLLPGDRFVLFHWRNKSCCYLFT